MVFFESIGIYIPEELCSKLSSTDTILGSSVCEDTLNILTQIRNAASRGNVDSERVRQAVEQVEKNLMDKEKAFRLLTGELSLQDLIPESNSSDLTSNPALQESSKIAVDTALSVVKRSFVTSMNNYVPSMYLDVSSLVTYEDTEYDPIASARFLRAINNLQKISTLDLSNVNFESEGLVKALRFTLLRLCDDFEKVQYNDFEIYKSQLEPPTEVSSPDDIEALRESQREEDGITTRYEDIKTTLRGSLIFGSDLSEELRATGIVGLVSPDAPDDPQGQMLTGTRARVYKYF